MHAKTCCFTGHRRIPTAHLAPLRVLTERMVRQLYAEGHTTFLAGGALGFDLLAAEVVLYLRDHVGLPIALHLILPCRGQEAKWSPTQQYRYHALLGMADDVRYTAERYTSGCMHARNRALVAAADACICYLTDDSGGTAYTVALAEQHGLPLHNLALQL